MPDFFALLCSSPVRKVVKNPEHSSPVGKNQKGVDFFTLCSSPVQKKVKKPDAEHLSPTRKKVKKTAAEHMSPVQKTHRERRPPCPGKAGKRRLTLRRGQLHAGGSTAAEKLKMWKLTEDFEVVNGLIGCKTCMRASEGKKRKRLEAGEAGEAGGPEKKKRKKLETGTLEVGGRNLLDTLRKHLHGPSHQAKAGARAKDEEVAQEEVVSDVPTDAQMYFTLDLVKKNPLKASGKDYEARCKDARESGDLKNVPPFRCSKFIFPQNVRSIAAATEDDVHARFMSKKNPVKFTCLAEDGAGPYEQIMCRTVFLDRTEEDFLLKWHFHQGRKTAIEKADAMGKAVDSFAERQPQVKEVLKKTCGAFVADGEAAEPLAAVLAKVKNVLPFRYVGRCLMHAKQRNMENAVATDELLDMLLDMLVRDYGDAGADLGGLCRALKNRDRHRHAFAEDVEKELDDVMKSLEALGEEWTG